MKRVLITVALTAFLLPMAMMAQLNLVQPTVSQGATALNIKWTAGTLNSGGHAVAVALGNAAVTANQTDCSAPTFAACNFLISNASGSVSVTQTLATAQTAGNILMAMIETGASAITRIAYPLQNGNLFTTGLGVSATQSAVSVFTPSAAGTIDIGSTALPFRSIFLGTAATNNMRIQPAATGAARVITMADPGGAATIAYTNSTTPQAMTGISSVTSSSATPAAAGILRLANTDTVSWKNAAGSNDISLQVNASNLLVLGGAGVTAPTDGYYFVPPGDCGLTLTTGTWAANVAAGTGAAAIPGVIKAQTGNSVLQGTTSAAANTFDMVCDITPPTRITATKGVTINDVQYMFGYQTTALTSIGTAGVNSITYGAAGAAAAGTVASIGGALTVTVGTSHGTPGAVTTSGQCYNEKLAFGTPYAAVVDNTRLTVQTTFVQSAAASTIMQICGAIVHYSNINSL